MPTSKVHRPHNTFIVYDNYNTVQRYQYVKSLNLFQRVHGGTLHTLAKVRKYQLTCLFATEITQAVKSTYHKPSTHGNCREWV